MSGDPRGLTAKERGALVAEARESAQYLTSAFDALHGSGDVEAGRLVGIIYLLLSLADELEASTATLTPDQAQKLEAHR